MTWDFTTYPRETQKHLQSIWSSKKAGHTHSISRFFRSDFGFVFLWFPSMFSLLRKFHCAMHFLFWCNSKKKKKRVLQNLLMLSITCYYLFVITCYTASLQVICWITCYTIHTLVSANNARFEHLQYLQEPVLSEKTSMPSQGGNDYHSPHVLSFKTHLN